MSGGRVTARLELGPRGVQRDVIAAYERVGCFVARTNQSYRRGARRNPGTTGLPDLYVFPPGGAPLARDFSPWWHETKRLGGKQRLEQKAWQLKCNVRGVGYVLGGVNEALAQLRERGLVA